MIAKVADLDSLGSNLVWSAEFEELKRVTGNVATEGYAYEQSIMDVIQEYGADNISIQVTATGEIDMDGQSQTMTIAGVGVINRVIDSTTAEMALFYAEESSLVVVTNIGFYDGVMRATLVGARISSNSSSSVDVWDYITMTDVTIKVYKNS